jgi:hypothetical protein
VTFAVAPGADGLIWFLAMCLGLLGGTAGLWVRGGAAPGKVAPGYQWFLSAAVPALASLGFALFLQLFEPGIFQIAGLLAAAVALGALYWSLAHTANPTDTHFSLAQTMLNVLVHLTAFLLFSVIYGLKLRSIFSATAVGLVTAILLVELLTRERSWHAVQNMGNTATPGTVALVLASAALAGEATWGLNYWAALTTLVGGAFLLVVFYVVAGLLSRYLEATLSRRIVLEYTSVGAVALAAIFTSAFI